MATSSKKQNDSDVLELEAEVIPLEKVIDNTLVKNNVTEAVISGLKEKYGGLKLKDVEDKESYLEICEARKDVRRYGILAEKICKVGREDAIKIQKLWLSKEKDILGKIAEVQDPLDVEIKKYEDEVKRKETLAIQQREEAYLKRQQQLLKYGATYQDGSFVLNHISYEANTIKDSDEEIFIETIIPKYLKEYEKNEAERVALEKKREEEALALKAAQGEMERQQRELAAQQEAFRKQQQELAQQQEQAQKAQREAEERERVFKTQQEEKIWRGRLELIDEVGWNGQFAFPKLGDHETKIFAYDELVHLPDNVFNARLKEANDSTIAHKKEIEEKRLAEIERQKTEVAQAAATAEREKIEREQAEEKLKAEQESKRKAEELEKATDKVKWQNFIAGINAVQFPETKHPAYKARVAEAKKMIDKINNL